VGAHDAEAESNVGSNLSRFQRWAKRLSGWIAGPSRMEITIQTDRLVIIRRRRSGQVWCPTCGHPVEVVDLQEAERLAGTAQPALPANVGHQAWHVCAGENGETLICLESLLKTG
jgi:hypothetical protein